jgi:rod shape-determining protein MreC
VRHQHRSAGRLHLPLRGISFRASLALSLLLATGLLFFGRAQTDVFERVRHAIEGVTGPFYEFVGPPIATARQTVSNMFRVFEVYRENDRLRAENAKLHAWRDKLTLLERENSRLAALLDLPLEPDIQYRTGRVIDDPGGPFVRTLRVNAGRRDGVVEGQAVVDDTGLVGRIVSAGASASRILLITDLNSNVPILIEPGSVRGMLIGQNDAPPVVAYLPKDHHVGVGSQVLTSGHGGFIPPNILVGEITAVHDDRATVRPASRFDRIVYVRVLEYHPPQQDVPYTTNGPPILSAHEKEMTSNTPQPNGEAATPAPAPQGVSQ